MHNAAPWKNRSVLLTGATGFIGRHFLCRLAADGARVRALVRPQSNPDALQNAFARVEVLRGDLRDADSLRRAVEGMDLVIHLAAATRGDWEEAYAATVCGTARLVELARAAGVRHFVHVSSMAVYDYGRLPRGAVVDESSPLEEQPHRRNHYARSKCEAETIVRASMKMSGMGITIVRPGAVCGPGGPGHLPPAVRVLGRRIALAIGGGRREIPLIHVDDLMDALLLLAFAPKSFGKIYNIVAGDGLTEADHVVRHFREQRRPVFLLPLPRAPFLLLARLYDAASRLLRRNPPSDVFRSLRRVTQPVLFRAVALQRDFAWRAGMSRPLAVATRVESMPLPRTGSASRGLACAIVGCGYIADVYMEALRGWPGVEVVAACDTHNPRLEAFCSRYRVPLSYASFDDLLREARPRFAVIATPPSTHAALCRAAIDAGVAVLVEKPACLCLAEARDLAARAARAGVPVAVMQNYRFKSNVQKALALCRSGELGELRRVDCSFHSGALAQQPEAWRRDERRNRLLLYEWAEHFLDLEVAFAGPLREILAARVRHNDAADSTLDVEALVQHKSGVTGALDLRLFAGAESIRVELHGSRRRVVLKFCPEGIAVYRGVVTPLHELFAEFTRAAEYAASVATARLRPGGVTHRARSHARFLREFVEFLEGRRERLPLSLEEMLPTMEFLDQLADVVYPPVRELRAAGASAGREA
jgi:predicted dehydrogenase/nucleoside-diphosphate-sugar epimerase